MALPTMRGYWPSHRNRYEQTMVRSREFEHDLRSRWSETANYFKNSDVWAAKQNGWSSAQAFQDSMDAFKACEEKNIKDLNLKRRRDKLSSLFSQENIAYEAELKGLSRSNSAKLEEIRSRANELKSAREETRQKLAEEKLYQQWRENDSDMKRLDSELMKEFTVTSWGNQLQEKEQRLETARQEKIAFEKQMEEERLAVVKADEQREAEKLEEEKSLKEILKQQMLEFRAREAEAKELKKQEDDLLRHKWDLEQIEECQRQKEQLHKKNTLGRALLRQHKTQMMHKSRLIQEELEQDKKTLEYLIRQESEQMALQSARREKARSDALWMKQVIDDQLRLEKVREAELDMLYQDEAARAWHKRESEWQKEREARQRLMAEVLERRREQIAEKLESLRRQQEESLEEREELVRDMELARQMTERDEEEQRRNKIITRTRLEEQMRSWQEQQQEQKEHQFLELEQQRQDEANYEDLLRQETQRLRLQGYTPRNHGRRQEWK